MKKSILIYFILTSYLYSTQEIKLSWLNQKPKSFAKDFYIWRYLDQDITPQEAKEALSGVRYLNNKILYRYINRSNDEVLKEYKRCKQAKTKDLIDKEGWCIEAGLSLYDATKLPKKDLNSVIIKVETDYKDFAKRLKILAANNKFDRLVNSDLKTFFGTFNQVGSRYRVKYFNHLLPKKFITKLKYPKFKKDFIQTIKLIVTNQNMDKIQKSLLDISPEGIGYRGVFFLAINAIKHNNIEQALVYLEDAYSKAYYKMEQDNVTFWQYQLTKDKKYLDLLGASWDTNIYTLYALEILNKKPKNIFFNIDQNNNTTRYDIKDPFSWLKVLKDTKKIDKEKLDHYKEIFTTKDTLGHLAFLYERYDRYKKSYFVLPFEKYMKSYTINRKALIYALGRQESRFIPSSISSSYAQGVMQIMPFLSKALAKQLNEPYNIDMQFDPKTNIKYASKHLNYLTSQLHNPLFIAYAYNGGIGFTKRLLKNSLFKDKKYEPYLSMELVNYDESRKYGKKVLANYFIYYNYLNRKKIKFSTLIKGITNI